MAILWHIGIKSRSRDIAKVDGMPKEKNSRIPQVLFKSRISLYFHATVQSSDDMSEMWSCDSFSCNGTKGENLFIFKLRLHKVAQNFEAIQKFKRKDELISVIIIMQLLTTTYSTYTTIQSHKLSHHWKVIRVKYNDRSTTFF